MPSAMHQLLDQDRRYKSPRPEYSIMQHPQRSQLAKRWQLDLTQNLFSGINLPSTGKTAPRGNPLISLYNQKTARGNIAGAVFQWKERKKAGKKKWKGCAT